MPNIEKNDTHIGPLYQFLGDLHCIAESSDDMWTPAAQVRAGPASVSQGGVSRTKGHDREGKKQEDCKEKQDPSWFCLEIHVNLGQSNKYLWGGGGDGLLAKLCLTLATPWTVAHQAPLFMGFSRQECWTGLPSLLQGFMRCYVHICVPQMNLHIYW